MQHNACSFRSFHFLDCSSCKPDGVNQINVEQLVMGRLVSVIPETWTRSLIYSCPSDHNLGRAAKTLFADVKSSLKLRPICHVRLLESDCWTAIPFGRFQPGYCISMQSQVADKDGNAPRTKEFCEPKADPCGLRSIH